MRRTWALIAAIMIAGCTGSQGPPDTQDTGPQEDANMAELELTSLAFEHGERIPERYGYTEENVSPPLSIAGVPGEAPSLVLIMDDPDAEPVAGKVWDHWILYDMSPDIEEIEEGDSPGVQGRNDYGEIGYGGPNPPDQEHTYVFTLYALDTELGLEEGATKEEVESAMEGHVLDEAVLEGTYAP